MDPGSAEASSAALTETSEMPRSNGNHDETLSLGNLVAFKPRMERSYLSVPSEVPLSDKTVGDLVDDAAKLYGSAEGLYDRAMGARLTFSDIKEETDILATGFLRLGLEKGDRVGIWGPNSRRWYITQLALAKAGIISVMVNPASTSSELLYCINKVTMRGLVMAGEFKGRSLCGILKEALPELSTSDQRLAKSERAPSLTFVITMEATAPYKSVLTYDQVMEDGRALMGSSADHNQHSPVSFDDVFCIQFTSGTTGKPKGVMLTHHNVVNNCESLGRRFEFIQQDKVCLPAPLFHIFGNMFGLIAGLRYGFSLVLSSPTYQPLEAVKAIVEEGCTVICGTPTMHVDILAVIEKDLVQPPPTTLRKVFTGGASCPVELAQQMKRTYGVDNVDVGYGMTEMSGTCLHNLPGDSDELRANTVGYPVRNYEIKIVNGKGEVVPVGVQGELCARSCSIMRGYWDDDERTREAIDANRWFHSGDLFVMEPSGHCRIVGRIKDMIIRGGENISPAEIENLLQSHPSIMEAHVFGVPDKRLGEAVAAWIRPHESETLDEEQVRQFCKEKISDFKIPKYIKFTSEFPKTSSGKIQKYQMRETTAEELGLP